MMRAFIYPYKGGSKSAKSIADATGGVRIKHRGSVFKPARNKLLVNWGSSGMPEKYMGCTVLNRPHAVGVASNKLKFFNKVEGHVAIPRFYTDKADAFAHCRFGGRTALVARTKLQGNSGDGIVMCTNDMDRADFPDAPLYTQYIKKTEEYRVHIFDGEVIMLQRKARRKDVPDDQVNWQVRNHDNGFIFQMHDVNPHASVIEEAAKAVAVLGLDFGAVDVIWNERQQQAYVLEVNCAPGLEGTTLERYADAINRRKVR